MSKAALLPFEPRKTPRQARSTESVSAIKQATIQVLLQQGKSKLTTTRIAERAGVSVGTLYQYFPNKNSVLKAVLEEHLDNVALAMETTCEAARGGSIAQMAEAVALGYVEAKFRNVDAGVALYAISDQLEGRHIARRLYTRASRAMVAMFGTARGRVVAEPEIVASTLLSAMAGVSRSMLEDGVTRGTMARMRQQLTVMVRAYLQASSKKVLRVPAVNRNTPKAP